MNKYILITILVGVITLGAGFFGGITYQKGQQPQRINGNFRLNVNGQGGQRFNGGNRPVAGQITAMDANSLTIKMPDGSTKIVIYSGSTKINKTTEGTTTDLKNGTEVSVIGNTGTDGTVTAQTIFIGGGFFQMRGTPMPSRNP